MADHPNKKPGGEGALPLESGLETSEEHARRVVRRGRIWRRVAVLVVFVILWATSAVLYSVSGRTEVFTTPDVENGILVTIDPVAIDPGRNEQVFRVVLWPVGDFAGSNSGELAKPINVSIPFNLSTNKTTTKYEAGDPLPPIEVRVYVEGEYVQYPLDHYDSGYLILVSTPSETDPNKTVAVPLSVEHDRGVSGWRTIVSGDVSMMADDTGQVTALSLIYELRRSGAVITFALLLLGLMVVLAMLGVVVASKVASRTAKVEATMASWFGAMIFALVPLRTFLPGAPPVGAWIDILVLFWVMIFLVGSLAVFIVTWWQTAPQGPPMGERRSG